MKKISALIAFALLASAAPFAEDTAAPPAPPSAAAAVSPPAGPKLPFLLEAGAGLYYNAAPLPEGPFGFLAAIANLRGGVWASVAHNQLLALATGFELGVQYIVFETKDSTGAVVSSTSVIDLPVSVKLQGRFGKLALSGLAGLLLSAVVDTRIDLSCDAHAGGRLAFGGLYAEALYVFGLAGRASHPRYGLGYSLKL